MSNQKARKEAWRGAERALQDGLVARIGVANYTPRHLEELLDGAAIRPGVNQSECHPYCQQESPRRSLAVIFDIFLYHHRQDGVPYGLDRS